jgi:hypothetical protein
MSGINMTTHFTKTDLADLKRAKLLLENPGLAARLSAMLGSQAVSLDPCLFLIKNNIRPLLYVFESCTFEKSLKV